MLIITIFFLFLFELRFKNYGLPNTAVLKYYISRKERVHMLQLLHTMPINPVVVYYRIVLVITALDWSGNLQSERTTVYSKKPSSMLTICCDSENQ